MRNSMYAEKSIKDLMHRFLKWSAGDLLGSRGGSHPAVIEGEVNLSAQGCIIGENDLGYQKKEKKINNERGCTTMKRGLILALVLVAAMIGIGYAADTTLDISVTVSCQYQESLAITGAAAFGLKATGSSSVVGPISVTNDSDQSSASIQFLKLVIQTEDSLTQWTAGSTPDIEVYTLSAAFAPVASAATSGDFEADDVLTTSAQYWDLTSGDVFNANSDKEYNALTGTANWALGYRGKLVSRNIGGAGASDEFDRGLYLKLATPLAVRSNAEHTITVRVTATATAE